MQFTDTHAHYFDRRFDALPGGAQGVERPCVPGIGARRYQHRHQPAEQPGGGRAGGALPFMAAAVGIHPEDCQVYPGAPGWYEGQKPLEPEEELPRLRAWLADPAARRRDKIVAIGEIGLDRHWQPVDSPRQQAFFDGRAGAGGRTGSACHRPRPRGARRVSDAVCRHEGVRGVFHGFSGSAEMAKDLSGADFS